jgi:hypothetical protein
MSPNHINLYGLVTLKAASLMNSYGLASQTAATLFMHSSKVSCRCELAHPGAGNMVVDIIPGITVGLPVAWGTLGWSLESVGVRRGQDFRPNLAPRPLSTGFVLQCRLDENSAREINSKDIS